MKNVSFVLIIILFSACSGRKNVVANSSNETVGKFILKDVAEVEKLSNSNPVSTETKVQMKTFQLKKQLLLKPLII